MGFKGTSHLLGARYLKKSLSGHQMTVDTMELLGEAHWLKLPTLARHHSNHLHELFYEWGPGKEHEAKKPPSTTRVQEKSKGGARCLPPPRILLTGIPLGWACHQETEQLAKDNLETNPITIKPETANHVAEKFSWVPLPCCSPPRHPFPNKTSCSVSMCVPQWVCDKSPLSGPGRGSPSCNRIKTSWNHEDFVQCFFFLMEFYRFWLSY